jgi:hypothetical protein
MMASHVVEPVPVMKETRSARGKTPGGVALGQDVSRDAKRLAAAILEVLAGLRTPVQAAEALTLSLPRYYQLEARGLRGLLAACEPRPKGRQRSPTSELAGLRQQYERLQRELARQQALVRLAQRAVGLTAPAAAAAKTAGKKSRQRKPVARALAVAARLRQDGATATSDNGMSQES